MTEMLDIHFFLCKRGASLIWWSDCLQFFGAHCMQPHILLSTLRFQNVGRFSFVLSQISLTLIKIIEKIH